MGIGKEKKLVNYLNNKCTIKLNDNWREILDALNIKGFILAKEIGGEYKADFEIINNKKSYKFSAKDGKGNSVHQEPLKIFLEFCKNNLKASNEILEIIEWFILERKDAKELYKENPKNFELLNKFFDKHKKVLLKRFLIEGLKQKNTAKYLYYGDIEDGSFVDLEEMIDIIINNPDDKILNPKKENTIKIGPLNFQAWNRNISGDKTKPSEKKRGHIQLKFPQIPKVINHLNKKYQITSKVSHLHKDAKDEEIELVKKLNSLPKEVLKKIFNISTKENVYAVHSTKKVKSIFDKKINPKADVFLIQTPNTYSQKYIKDTQLKKEDIKIEKTGISVKMKNSQKYTILKISPNHFEKLLPKELGAMASLYTQVNDNNKKIIKGWNTNLKEINKFLKQHNQKTLNLKDPTSLQEVKTFANEKIKQEIINNKILKDKLIWGKGLMDEPFCATYFYQNNKLIKKDDIDIDFIVTTGSGRSKGDYTIVLKPKNIKIKSITLDFSKISSPHPNPKEE